MCKNNVWNRNKTLTLLYNALLTITLFGILLLKFTCVPPSHLLCPNLLFSDLLSSNLWSSYFVTPIVFMVENVHLDIRNKKNQIFKGSPLRFGSFFKFGFGWKFQKRAKYPLKFFVKFLFLFPISKCIHFSTIKNDTEKSLTPKTKPR